jgi:hypothetical protein
MRKISKTAQSDLGKFHAVRTEPMLPMDAMKGYESVFVYHCLKEAAQTLTTDETSIPYEEYRLIAVVFRALYLNSLLQIVCFGEKAYDVQNSRNNQKAKPMVFPQ